MAIMLSGGTSPGTACIPFEITADPFYSEKNIKHLEQVIADIAAGRAKLFEHDLAEAD
jgi:DNA-damage-inducible protein J